MTKIKFYKFFKDYEMHWIGEELIIFIPFDNLNKFTNLITNMLDSTFKVVLKDDCISFDLAKVCDYYNIEPQEIKSK